MNNNIIKTRNFSGNKTLDMIYISLFAVIIAICSWISIPSAVPFTLQTMAVFTTVGILGGKRGTISVFLYILLGAIGLPVFAGFTGGFGILLGSTGGYIVGFLFSALLMWGIEALFGNKRIILILSMFLGLLLCYALGTAWFILVYTKTTGEINLITVLGWCVIPFIIPDFIKIALSYILTVKLKKFVDK